MGLDLKTGDIVFLDTAPFIYFFEQHPHHFPGLKRFFDRLYAANDLARKYFHHMLVSDPAGAEARDYLEGRGVGLACSSYLCGAGLPIYWNKMPHSGVQLKLDRGGGVTVFCGCTEIGQGSDDVLVGLVADQQ